MRDGGYCLCTEGCCLVHVKISPLVAMHIKFDGPSNLPDGVSIGTFVDVFGTATEDVQ